MEGRRAGRADQAAKTWFKKYCIDLTFREFALDPPLRKPGEKEKRFEERTREFERKKKEFEALLNLYESRSAQISRGEGALQKTYVKVQETVIDLYSIIAAAQPKKLVVLFLDEWWVPLHPGGTRVRASANHQDQPLIGLNRYDRASPLMLAHELAHGLRKNFGGGNEKCVKKFLEVNKVEKEPKLRPWHDHYPPARVRNSLSFS